LLQQAGPNVNVNYVDVAAGAKNNFERRNWTNQIDGSKTRARERERETDIYIYIWVGWSDQWLIILIDWMGCISCDLFFLGTHLSIGITLQDVIASLWRGLITWTRYQVLLSRIQAKRHPWGQNPMNMKGKLKGKELLWHRLIASV
jgi:hypothetical protein